MTKEFLIKNRYRVVGDLGRGGMATVYKAVDTVLGRTVALKVLHPQYSQDPVFLARFTREAQAAAALDHPGVVEIHDVGQDDDRHFIVMEFVDGQDLKTLIREEAPLPIERAVDLAIQICAAVGHAHVAGLIHRDVKPQNVLVTADDRVKVTDFGIARAAAEAGPTEPGVVWGTAHYLSPEQAVGQPATPASDVYALGVVLYEMLAGRPPFEADSRPAIAAQHVQAEPPPIQQFNPRVPPQLAAIIARAMAKDPVKRYPTANELGQALRAYRQLVEELTAPQPAVAAPGAERVAPTPAAGFDWATLLLGLVALAAVLGLIPLWHTVRAAYAPPPTPTATPTVRVPSLVGLDQREARQRAEEAGLTLELLGTRPDDQVPALLVVEQSPPAGSSVAPNSRVAVILSSGPAFVLVPDVVGATREAAEAQLRQAGLTVSVEEEWGGDVPAGTVMAQEPLAGEGVPKGRPVRLVVSTGRRLPVDAVLGDLVRLVEAELERVEVQPGETLRVTLRWRAEKPVGQDLVVFVHLAGPDGRPIVQHDGRPAGGARPTATWTPGETVEDPHELQVPGDALTGTYELRVGLYRPDTLARLPVTDPGRVTTVSNSLLLRQIKVGAP